MTASRSWLAALWVVGATLVFAAVWYAAVVRRATELSLAFALIEGGIIMLAGFGAAVALAGHALAARAARTPRRIAVAVLLVLAIWGLMLGIAYVA